MTIAIIGAGMAGAACGQVLAKAGQDVVVFDKGRGPGGRMSTRRAQTPLGEIAFDHGAQYVTARDPAFIAQMQIWAEAGAAAAWTARYATMDATGAVTPETPADIRWVGVPGMNGLVRAGQTGLDVRFGARVTAVFGKCGALMLAMDGSSPEGPFDVVVCAAPAEQTPALIGDVAPDLAREAAEARSAPCWTLMAAFETRLDVDFDAAQRAAGPLSWIARNASKPGRGPAEAWVAHASPDWSEAHLEDGAEDVGATLSRALIDILDAPPPLWTAAHRWRYAQIAHGAGSDFGWDAGIGVGVWGDWRLGPRVELAWLSGHRLGQAILADLG